MGGVWRCYKSTTLPQLVSSSDFSSSRGRTFITSMRVVVFLCLLHLASPQVPGYSWDGPIMTVPPNGNTGSACTVDQSSCGCCWVLREVNRVKTYFETTMANLEKEYAKTNQSLQAIENNRVAFTVSLFLGDAFKCFGPFAVNNIVLYKLVFLNYGGAYNPDTGIFTVPYAGVYSLAVTVYSDAGSPGNMLAECATLQVNGQPVASAKDMNTNDKEDSATIAVALNLQAKDKVSVLMNRGCYLCDDFSHYNTFSAFLLYPTE